MLLTDHEWLRFVTFALVVGATLGALYTAALISVGNTLLGATAGAVAAGGAFAVLSHLVCHWVLGRQTTAAAAAGATTPGVEDETDTTPEDSA